MSKDIGGKEVGRISIRVVPDTSKFRDRLKADLEALERVLKGEISMGPDMDGFREKVKAASSGMEATVKVKADTDRLKKSMREVIPDKGIRLQLDPQFDYQLRQRLHRIGAIKVPVVPDERTFLSRVKSMMSSVGDSLSNIKAPSFGSGINPTGFALIAALLAAISPLIAGLLGALTTGLLALPGLISAMAVPIGALALGMDGLKRAASVLKNPFDDLRAAMSAKVEEQFTPFFAKLAGIFPTLKGALPSVTKGLADMAQSFADVLTDPSSLAKIDQTIRNIATGLKEAAPGIGDFTKGFLDLINGFSTKLPDIGKWFSETGASFSTWVSEFTAKGPDGVSRFDVALVNLCDTMKTIGGGLVELAGKAIDFFSDPEKVKSFKAELDGLVNTVLALADGINTIASAMSKIPGLSDGKADSLMDFAPIQVQLIAGLFPKIRQGVADTIASIMTEFSTVPERLGAAWSGLAGIAQGAWSTISATVSGAITNIISTLVNGGFQIMGEIGTWPGKITAALGDMGSLLVAAGKALMDGLLNGIKAGFEAVKNFVGTIAGTIASLKGPLPYDRIVLTPNGEALMEGLGTGLQNGFQNVLAMAKEMAQQISRAMSDGTDLSGMLGGNKFPDLTKMLDTLEQERKSLKVQLDNTADKGMKDQLRDQIKQLQAVKDQLKYDKDKLKNAQKYGGELANQVGTQDSIGQKIYDAGVNFAKATKDQTFSDLNIGGGAISNLGDELMDWGLNAGKKFIFNVNSMDEALAGQRNLVNREALQFDRR
ncbi:cation transporter [Mycobacteroides abscessus]|uniref:cation transporter n=1 Tax=Mycobacteroides abscessus TaxID=36809 RepID=UPI001C72097D|nr:cation transporter [Mycobacteroides abscessus]